ncbi:MAG: AAA family ATPase [Legionellales bacterium RIFCSPHIGHO2_12_FULL_37_14]|nr:MAG: AAA family ATPase [Legionellales bacterium RIFCSPHIGHO2_12_FULL_37_14]
MFIRQLAHELQDMMKYYPIVTLIGPRQSGKTTLVKELYPNLPYVSLENPDEKRLASTDPVSFLARFPNGAIIDEVQRYPELLSYLQGIVDKQKQNGLFILTGSHQLALHGAITQSLAGRTAILKLLPFNMQELSQNKVFYDINDYLFQGMYPRCYQNDIPPTKFYRDYMQTYVERDVRQMIQLKDLSLFQQFLHLCAGYVGQLINLDSLSNALGISATTVKHWISILEASFIVFRLPPYYENFGKRIIKSHKLYFYDVGLATYLLDIKDKKDLAYSPMRGSLVENFIILELLKNRLNQGIEPSMYFYRDNSQKEIDLILKNGAQLIPIEIKSAQTFTTAFLQGLTYFKQLVGQRCKTGYLIYTGHQAQKLGDFHLINFRQLGEIS